MTTATMTEPVAQLDPSLLEVRPEGGTAASAASVATDDQGIEALTIGQPEVAEPKILVSTDIAGARQQARRARKVQRATLAAGQAAAPFARTGRQRTARYRMSRKVKRELLDGFCGLRSDGAPPRTLIVVAHPDDELIGAGARVAELSDVTVAYVTNGAPRNPEVARRHECETVEEYAARRYEEAMAALALAGLSSEQVTWMGIVDGEASLRLVELCLKMAELLDEVRPNVVITHPYEGGHTDHDATAFAVHLACGLLRREGQVAPAVFELTSYNGLNGEKVVQQFLPHQRADQERRLIRLDETQSELKQRMFECFGTQQRVLQDFRTTVEEFRPAPRYLFTRPPHEGTLNYERYGNPDLGRLFRENAAAALQELRVRRGR